jgi:putative endonuclease
MGEEMACQYYRDQGFEIVARNFQYYREGVRGRMGELDIIAYKKELLCIVEVKTRSNQFYGPVSGQISLTKLQNGSHKI